MRPHNRESDPSTILRRCVSRLKLAARVQSAHHPPLIAAVARDIREVYRRFTVEGDDDDAHRRPLRVVVDLDAAATASLLNALGYLAGMPDAFVAAPMDAHGQNVFDALWPHDPRVAELIRAQRLGGVEAAPYAALLADDRSVWTDHPTVDVFVVRAAVLAGGARLGSLRRHLNPRMGLVFVITAPGDAKDAVGVAVAGNEGFAAVHRATFGAQTVTRLVRQKGGRGGGGPHRSGRAPAAPGGCLLPPLPSFRH